MLGEDVKALKTGRMDFFYIVIKQGSDGYCCYTHFVYFCMGWKN